MSGFWSIVLPVPEAEDLVDPFRRTGDWSRAHGVPAHITLAGPWAATVPVPLQALSDLAAGLRGSRHELDSIGSLGAALCLFTADEGPLLEWRERALAMVGSPDRASDGWPCTSRSPVSPDVANGAAAPVAIRRSS